MGCLLKGTVLIWRAVWRAFCMAFVLMFTWALLSTAVCGGWWVPGGISHISGSGYWLLIQPTDAGSFGFTQGSESYAQGSSVGRLKDIGGNDHFSTICDNYRNFKDAVQSASNLNGRENTTADANGVADGCGGEVLGFDADAHVATEGRTSDGGWIGTGNVSYHRND